MTGEAGRGANSSAGSGFGEKTGLFGSSPSGFGEMTGLFGSSPNGSALADLNEPVGLAGSTPLPCASVQATSGLVARLSSESLLRGPVGWLDGNW